MARHAATAVIKGGKVDRNVMEAFQKAEEWFDWLDQMLKPTNERRSLRGSLYKRMATILPDRRLEYLQRSLDSYGFGTDPAAVAGYKSTNALALAFVLAKPSGLAALVARADRFQESMPQQQAGSDRDFWGVVTRPDALLHWHVLHQSLDGTALTNLTAEYAQAWQARPSPRQWASVTDHVYFLTVMTADTRLRCHHPATSAVLEQLHAILTTRNFEGDAPRGAAKRQSRRTAARKTARTRRSKTSTRARPKARRPRR
jgi:hypothetical protein